MDLERDQNFRTVGGGVAPADIHSIQPLQCDPATDRLLVLVTEENPSVSPLPMDKRDQNFRPTMYGVSSVDGVTPVPIRTNDDGAVLVDIEFT